MEDEFKVRLKPFNGTKNEDFMLWSMRVQSYLEGHDLFEIATGEIEISILLEVASEEDKTQYAIIIKKERKAALGDRSLRAINRQIRRKACGFYVMLDTLAELQATK